jgi:multidrug efflux pump subunit AcrB
VSDADPGPSEQRPLLERVARACVGNKVPVHLATLALLAAGAFLYATMPREIFPEFTREKVRVTTYYPGASPEDVEELVTIKVEDAVDAVDGIEEVESLTQEGVSRVVARLQKGAEMTRVLQDVDRAVAAIRQDLPTDLDVDPLVEEVKTRFPVITVSIYGDVSELALKDLVRPVQRRIEAIPGVANVQPTGLRELEWRIEARPDALLRFGLTLGDVARALAAQNLSVPGGSLERPQDEVLLRTKGETLDAAAIEAVVLRALPDGSHVRVGDVARVTPGFERALTIGRYAGRPSLNLVALKERDGDIIDIARRVRELARELPLPPGVHAAVHTDLSVFLNDRIDIMESNALQGFVLVVITLCLLLHWRIALIAAFGIPTAFFAALILMAVSGISINMMSLFGLILVLGMLVDDAIIVAENVHRRMENGEGRVEAAIKGTAEVAAPVIATVVTTICAFMPMLLIEGEMGQWMWQVPVIVALCLLASLLECFTALPSHIAEFASKTEPARADWFDRLAGRHDALVRWCLARRYPVMAGAFGASILVLAITTSAVGFVLLGEFESETYFLNFELPSTSSLEQTSERARELERIVLALPPEELAACITNVGVSAINVDQASFGPYLGQVVFTFTKAADRTRTATELLDAMRLETAKVQGFTKLEFKGLQAGPGGSPIEVALEGDDMGALRLAADELQAWLRAQPGVQDIYDDSTPGKAELEVAIDPEAAAAVGLTTQAVAQQVRDAFHGREATTVRRRDEDVELMVRFARADRAARATLEELWLDAPAGRVPFQAVARAHERRGLAKIVRGGRRRAITVFADVDVHRANAIEVTNRLQRLLEARLRDVHGVDLKVKGQRREAEQSMTGLVQAFVISCFLIYFVLGTQLRSYTQPLMVMVAIPFGIDGIFIGHMLLGLDISFLSMMGLVAVTGIVVNDSMVLVEFVNRMRAQGHTTLEAAARASTLRLRQILLTSVATVVGLFPMAFFATGQAKFLSPMAVSILFGIAFSTGLTLFVIPCLYAILDDVRSAMGWVPREEPAEVEV